MEFLKNCLTSIFKWLLAWKWSLPRPNVSYECLSPSPTLSYTIIKKKTRAFYNEKVIEGPEAPEGPLRVLFRFLSDRVLLRVLSDKILFESSVIGSSSGSSVIHSFLGPSVLLFQLFIETCYYYFFNKSRCSVLHYIFKKNFTLKN